MDVDDVAAISIAHAMQDNGECNILAIVQNTQPPKCAGVISVINHYYGRDDIPIGARNCVYNKISVVFFSNTSNIDTFVYCTYSSFSL